VRRSLAAVAIALCVATAALALDIPPKPTAWVTDNAGVLSSEQAQALNEKLEALAKNPSGAQFLIMVFPSLEGEDVDDYANRVADQWKVKGDRALILLVFIRDHKMAIRTGYSLEADVTDAISSRVIRETMAPYFRQNQYYEGLDAAVNDLGKRIDPNYSPQSRSLPSAPRSGSGSSQLAPRDLIFLVVLILIFIFVIAPIMRRSGCGGCSGCIFPMFWGGGGGGTTFGGGGGGGGGGWSVGGSWGGGGGSSFGGGGASVGW
jgi:uncharacterized protein